MNDVVEVIDNRTWEEFIEDNPKSNIKDKKFIYRGQSNGFVYDKEGNPTFKEWNIVSSFNRFYVPGSRQYNFEEFISQQISFIPSKYSEYEFVKKNNLDKANAISQIYFLQHYGVPTCFIDFTFHPLVALYFSISAMKGQSGGSYPKGLPNFYPDEYVFSIYKIDVEALKKVFKIHDLKHTDIEFWLNYDFYKIKLTDLKWAHLALDLDPLSKIDNQEQNFNIRKQHSCFLMYDNGKCNIGFEEFLAQYIKEETNEPIIYKYRFKYNSAYRPIDRLRGKVEPLFNRLRKEKVIGKDLFNDIQGIKYDFNFFHQEF